MEKTETAVEWLFFEMKGTKWINADWEKRRLIIEQAKAMEKEQIIIAYQSERYPCSDSDAEQYYNEIYGSK